MCVIMDYMDMAIDSKKIINKASHGVVRKPAGFSLDVELVEKFRKACDANNVKYSEILESLIREFLEDLKKK